MCKNKVERSGKFKKGSVNRFVLELKDVGERISKIRIGHDNSGLGAGWHIDKVVIRKQNKKGKVIGYFLSIFWIKILNPF